MVHRQANIDATKAEIPAADGAQTSSATAMTSSQAEPKIAEASRRKLAKFASEENIKAGFQDISMKKR